eukprot:CAMPEP_0185765156 /NCGR_PEP_ID=MMETSP1174-20130828/26595_1 /TAXON_ID=35687 /ORGANISM="Dictyocha speculum, Strain CCMP1381" /LENGTH=99 /DNA_ID=CAMNT_0028448093 /DNA_START=215 /DNA_END=514 /DNA_ORIENTATION=+
MTQPSPIMQPSRIVHDTNVLPAPMVLSLRMSTTAGKPDGKCEHVLMTTLSPMDTFDPTLTSFLSPKTTALYQTDTWLLTLTSPITVAEGAMKASEDMNG